MKRYGRPVTLQRLVQSVADITSGVVSRTTTDYAIERAIVLTGSVRVQAIYDLSYIAANKNFTYGAEMLHRTITVLIDNREIVKSGCDIIQTQDVIIIAGVQYIVAAPKVNSTLDIAVLVCKEAGDHDG